MTPRSLFIAVLAVSLFNGLTSPFLLLVRVLAPIWMPDFLPATPQVQFYFASLIVSFGTLLLAGIPAAVVERLRGQAASDTPTMWLWLACAVALSLPGLQSVATLAIR
jgi:hypothetical protein